MLAQCLVAGGYQATAIGKLHVYPQRDRIGFENTLLADREPVSAFTSFHG
mgnify:CR=1 FL=1